MLLGTAAYMSPEQVRGQAADRRADVWAFGLVLMEMLTGKTAYPGDTISDTLAGVLRADPEWTDLPHETPRSIRTLLERCADKNPRTRLRDIGEARISIERYLADPAAETRAASAPAPAPRASSPARWLPWTLALLGVVLAAWATSRAPRPAQAPRIARFSVGPPAGRVTQDQYPTLDVARDGSRLTFTARDEAGERRVYVRAIEEIAAVPIPGTARSSRPTGARSPSSPSASSSASR
jgi:hypothetical protein